MAGKAGAYGGGGDSAAVAASGGKKKDGAGGFGLRNHLQVSGSGGSRTSQFEESLLLFPVKAHELAIEVEQGIIWSDDDILKLNKVEVMCAQFVLLADHAFK